MRATFDSNILIDYFNQVSDAVNVIAEYDEKLLSIIAYIEIMSGIENEAEKLTASSFLKNFSIVFVDNAIAEESINLRQSKKLKLPDAIIYATAKLNNCPLITRDTKDFGPGAEDIKVPYNL